MSYIGADVLAEWRVIPKDVASLPVFALGSRGGFVVEGVLISAFVKCFLVRWGVFNLCIPSSAFIKLSTLCQGRLYPHIHLYIYIYIYIYIYS